MLCQCAFQKEELRLLKFRERTGEHLNEDTSRNIALSDSELSLGYSKWQVKTFIF